MHDVQLVSLLGHPVLRLGHLPPHAPRDAVAVDAPLVLHRDKLVDFVSQLAALLIVRLDMLEHRVDGLDVPIVLGDLVRLRRTILLQAHLDGADLELGGHDRFGRERERLGARLEIARELHGHLHPDELVFAHRRNLGLERGLLVHLLELLLGCTGLLIRCAGLRSFLGGKRLLLLPAHLLHLLLELALGSRVKLVLRLLKLCRLGAIRLSSNGSLQCDRRLLGLSRRESLRRRCERRIHLGRRLHDLGSRRLGDHCHGRRDHCLVGLDAIELFFEAFHKRPKTCR